DLVCILGAEGHHAQIVAEELYSVVVLLHVRKLGEEGALVRLLDMLLQGEHPLGLGEAEELVEQAQQLDVILLLVGWAFERALQTGADRLQVSLGIADDEGARRSAQDDQELVRLDEDGEMAAVHE